MSSTSTATAGGSDLTTWTQRVGKWSVSASGATTVSGSSALLASPTQLGANFSVSADVLAPPSTNRQWNGIAVGVTDGDNTNFYVLRYTAAASAQGSPAGWQLIRNSKPLADSSDVEANGALSEFDASTAITVSMSSDGLGRMSVAFAQNGKQLASQSVTLRPGYVLTGGRAALYSLAGGGTKFSNVDITSGTGTPFSSSDSFTRSNGPTLGVGWQIEDGQFAIQDNGAVSSRTESGRAVASPVRVSQSSSGFAVIADVRPGSQTDTDWAGVAINCACTGIPKNDSYYALQIAPGSGWRLIQHGTSGDTVLGSGQISITASASYRIRVAIPTGANAATVDVQRGGTQLAASNVALPSEGRLTGGNPALIASTVRDRFTGFAYIALSQSPSPKPTSTLIYTRTAPYNTQSFTAVNGQLSPTPNTSVVGKTYSVSSVSQSLVTDYQHYTNPGSTLTMQYVGFYDASGYMSVAKRALPDGQWSIQRLAGLAPTNTDSHDSISLGIDPSGAVHIAGNMHAEPLVYYRTSSPGDITTFKRIASMVDSTIEQRVTYPLFFMQPSEGSRPATLWFTFRSGSSGNGSNYYYSWNGVAWIPALTSAMFGNSSTTGSTYNAYPADARPTYCAASGKFQMAWIWRRSGDAKDSLHINYMQSSDFSNWTTAGGSAIALPVTFDASDPLVDSVDVQGGAINGLVKVGCDHQGHPVLVYSKFDNPSPGPTASLADYTNGPGSNQIFAAAFSNGSWKSVQITNNFGRWAPQGIGSISFPLGFGAPTTQGTKSMTDPLTGQTQQFVAIPYDYDVAGTNGRHYGTLVLDEQTLQPVADTARAWSTSWINSSTPAASHMSWVTVVDGSGADPSDGSEYVMAWGAYPITTVTCADGTRQSSDACGSGYPVNPQPLTVYKRAPMWPTGS